MILLDNLFTQISKKQGVNVFFCCIECLHTKNGSNERCHDHNVIFAI